MFYFGIDWSEEHHNLCIMNEAGGRVSQIELKHTLMRSSGMLLKKEKGQ
jgi:hypothetical protein